MNSEQICMSCMKDKGNFGICPHCGWTAGTAPKEIYHLHPKSILSKRYIIGIVLGYGGFGVTYKAWDTFLNVQVAIKEFFPNRLVNRIPGEDEVIIYDGEKRKQYENGLEGFLEEARNMAKFNNHPNIVNVSDYFLQNSTAYIVMEYLEGLTLNDYLSSAGDKLKFKEAIDIINPILNALKAVHKEHLIHRDVSPHNIMITADNKIKLIDLGAARYSFAGHEKSMSIVLKPGYAPPEQYRSKSKQGAFSDIYAVGATLYRMISGVVPDESVDRMMDDELKKPSELDVDLPLFAEKAIMKSLALKENLRFQNIQDFIDAIVCKKEVDFPEIELSKRRRRRSIISIAAAVFLIVAGGFLFLYKPVQLEPDTLTIWVPVEENTDMSEYEKLANKFIQDFEDVNVDIVEVPKEIYSNEILKSKENGTLPDLYRSDLLNDEYLGFSTEMDDLFDFIDIDEFYFLDQYEIWFPNKKQMPLGFNAYVLYSHAGLAEDAGVKLSTDHIDKKDFFNSESKYTGIYSYWFYIDSNYYDEFVRSIDSSAKYDFTEGEASLNNEALQSVIDLHSAFIAQELSMDIDGENMFYEDEVGFMFSDTSKYNKIQNALPGYYQVLPPPGDGTPSGDFTEKWSISDSSSKNRQLGATIFLSYMLSDYAQDYLILQGNKSIPIRRETFERYIGINKELDFLNDLVLDISFNEQGKNLINEFNTNLRSGFLNNANCSIEKLEEYISNYNN